LFYNFVLPAIALDSSPIMAFAQSTKGSNMVNSAKSFLYLINHCFVWLLCLSFSAGSWANKIVPANTSNYVYSGRIDFSQPTSPMLSWPGSSINANFTGSYLAVILDDERGKNYFNIIIDKDDNTPFILRAKPGTNTYVISASLTKGAHSLEIYKRTEGEEGSSRFKGLVIEDDATLLPAPLKPQRRIEIFGDSISSGMGNEGADDGADNLPAEKNNYMAYGSIAARALNAELHTISQSGIGVMISWFDFIMPQFYDQLSAVGNNDSQWDFVQWTPDVVLINLMQNDKWLIDNVKRLQPVPTDNERVSYYQDFVTKIRARYPKAQIICALGSMDATQDNKWPNYVRQAVNNLEQAGDHKIDNLFFEYTGYNQHPRITQHKANAAMLEAFIRQKMHWD
jgi:hypothetical protein